MRRKQISSVVVFIKRFTSKLKLSGDVQAVSIILLTKGFTLVEWLKSMKYIAVRIDKKLLRCEN
jgi:hypothetical protein